MAPQVGLEPHPEIPTANAIVLKFSKKTRKTNVDAVFRDAVYLPIKTQKALKSRIGGTKAVQIFLLENGCAACACLRRRLVRLKSAGSLCDQRRDPPVVALSPTSPPISATSQAAPNGYGEQKANMIT